MSRKSMRRVCNNDKLQEYNLLGHQIDEKKALMQRADGCSSSTAMALSPAKRVIVASTDEASLTGRLEQLRRLGVETMSRRLATVVKAD
ncbi:MAG: hypothetical protein ACK5KM_01955 [Hyphomicrobiaceae bacterium]